MLTIAATIAAICALFGQGYTLPSDFVDGALSDAARPKVTDRFIGVVWDCDDERCFAGIATRRGISFLHTGP